MLEGALEGGATPGAGVDVPLDAQAFEGVVEVGRETNQPPKDTGSCARVKTPSDSRRETPSR